MATTPRRRQVPKNRRNPLSSGEYTDIHGRVRTLPANATPEYIEKLMQRKARKKIVKPKHKKDPIERIHDMLEILKKNGFRVNMSKTTRVIQIQNPVGKGRKKIEIKPQKGKRLDDVVQKLATFLDEYFQEKRKS